MRGSFFGIGAAAIATSVLMQAATSSAQADTITFGTYAGPDFYGSLGPSYTEKGITFTNDIELSRWRDGLNFDSDPTPSTGLFTNIQYTTTVMRKAGGGSFNLVSMQADDVYFEGWPNGALDYSYTLSGGGSGTGSFLIDNVPGFSTLLLNLVGVTEFSFTPSVDLMWVQIDNVVVTGVAETPLPAALPLFVAALAGLGLMAKRRRSIAA